MAQTKKHQFDEELKRFSERAEQDKKEQKEHIDEFLAKFEKDYRARINERKGSSK